MFLVMTVPYLSYKQQSSRRVGELEARVREVDEELRAETSKWEEERAGLKEVCVCVCV